MAADSAVTIAVPSSQGKSYKVLNSANKLFALSKYAPVGLMIYGNGSLLGVPWESIIKIFRRSLGGTEYPSLDDYCSHFFSFLDRFEVSQEVQDRYVIRGNAEPLFRSIRKELDTWVTAELEAGRVLTELDISNKLDTLVNQRWEEFDKIKEQSVFTNVERSSLQEKYKEAVEGVAKEVFEKHPLSVQAQQKLLTIAIVAASVGRKNQSGIVIAGFGSKSLYPSYKSFDVAAVLAGRTVKRQVDEQAITDMMGAAIVPFAQSDDVHTFMRGIGPTLNKFLDKTFRTIMTSNLPEKLVEAAVGRLSLSTVQAQDLRKIAEDMCAGATDAAFGRFAELQKIHYIDPVVRATEFLNKGELAAMAETLVNLVSFRKQVTMEAETVGGPIDVAVITQGDGFIWIKRKHYFQQELNHHFFHNYFRRNVQYGQDEPTQSI